MLELNPLWFVLLVELVALLLFALVAGGVSWTRRRRKDREAARSLVTKTKAGGDQRREETRRLLDAKFGLEGDELDRMVREIHKHEKSFYRDFIKTWLTRDTNAVVRMDLSVEELVQPYRALKPIVIEKEGAGGELGDRAKLTAKLSESKAEVKRLREENERLTEELGAMNVQMDQMAAEYAKAFEAAESARKKQARLEAEAQPEEVPA